MTHDTDTLELRRIVADDPAHTGAPDLPSLVGAGRRRLARRRAAIGGTTLAVAAAIVVPTALLAGGGIGSTAPDRTPVGPADNPAVAANGPTCGVLSCIQEDGREDGRVLAELSVGPLGAGEEVVYLVRTHGVDLGTNEPGPVTVLKAGYRLDGTLFSTLWGPQPSDTGTGSRPFWYNAGFINAQAGTGGHYVVVGYVEGTPEEITWSTPDGGSGPVGGQLAVGDRTIFYLTLPLPTNYEAPEHKVIEKDGQHQLEVDGDSPEEINEGRGPARIGDLGGTPYEPEVTIHTSDGWSCSLADCGSTG